MVFRGNPARKRRKYVGPFDDPKVAKRDEAFQEIKDHLRSRRKLVSTLTREAGLTAPDRFTGDVVEAMGTAGIFRLRGVLVGMVAFQTYAGVSLLVEALKAARRQDDLATAFSEAWGRWQHWREAMLKGLRLMPPKRQQDVEETVKKALIEIGEELDGFNSAGKT